MNTLKRLTSTIKANFDWMVTQVENHEGLVASAITEVQAAQARAKVHYAQMKRDGEKLQRRLDDVTDAEKAWTDRAIQAHAIDEQKALECVRRKIRAQKDKKEIEDQIKTHERLEQQLSKDLSLIDQRLDQLRRQRNVLRTRQPRAEALRAAKLDEGGIVNELDEILERWEIKVTQAEVQSECVEIGTDELEAEYSTKEEETLLRESLKELVNAAK